jgi:hypothetical protein
MVEDPSKAGVKVSTRLAPGMKDLLDQCINRNLYGDQSATIRHFINVGLERLVKQGRLIDTPALSHITPQTDMPDDVSSE